MHTFTIGAIVRHFKREYITDPQSAEYLYKILAFASHTETGEKLVIYQALYGEFQVFARPLSMFLEKVDAKKYPDAAGKDRFMRIPMAEAAAVARPVAAPSENPVEPRPAAMPSESIVESRAVAASSENSVEPQPDPGLLAFLDADSYEEKLEVFAALEGKVDLHMLNAIAASLDLELSEGSLEEQYDTLKSCLMTLERYECNRLR